MHTRPHTHGTIDPVVATTATGVRAIKWSFVVLAATAALQLVIALASGSVALLTDSIHNVGDAATAIPLWIAFVLARRGATRRFSYGLGRFEDLAGLVIVAIIFSSGVVAGYQAFERLLHPVAVARLGWVAVAGAIGFVGNEAVAGYRIRVGRAISSAALIADGRHARSDGLASLAVVLGALAVFLGYPLADPVIGLIMTLVIFGIVWQSARAVLTRLLDGVEPRVLDEIQHAADHVQEVDVARVQARWLGHRLQVDLTVVPRAQQTLDEVEHAFAALRHELVHHVPGLGSVQIQFEPRTTR